MIAKWKYIWLPLAALNWCRGWLKNRLFDMGVWKSVEFEVPVIYVGSLATDCTIGLSKYVQDLLGGALYVNKYRLSEYGIEKEESLNYCTKLSEERAFSASHKVLGLSEWYQNHPDTSAFIMDGDFARNEIRPHFRVMVMDFKRPFFNDEFFPIGTLNESKKTAKTADIVVVVETPEKANCDEMENEMRSFLKDGATVFFIKHSIDSLKSYNSADKIEFISDRDNFERLILNILPNANLDSE
ncbi:MAG: tetraacyldisaccharide 4'-kinase [Reichenbachiella sp.]|uniref:tetraacyldisaccharide 4'-kinase n=1 Tax=Reichenbachiella sp. TaxID=2184521 RepID=UPI003298EB5A